MIGHEPSGAVNAPALMLTKNGISDQPGGITEADSPRVDRQMKMKWIVQPGFEVPPDIAQARSVFPCHIIRRLRLTHVIIARYVRDPETQRRYEPDVKGVSEVRGDQVGASPDKHYVSRCSKPQDRVIRMLDEFRNGGMDAQKLFKKLIQSRSGVFWHMSGKRLRQTVILQDFHDEIPIENGPREAGVSALPHLKKISEQLSNSDGSRACLPRYCHYAW